ncbi:GDYXXLXY domain-containing protein [Sphingobium bisphenolivorans]|uniref:GDYXXLXY domain-containing protein n=1 Tax=Sphingobium bisphenolivorans TaxID=1335760 RepID=UPI00039D1BE1|nr:GDYXXLXY domain-containing protein [Sphingobium bisphenolivorans]
MSKARLLLTAALVLPLIACGIVWASTYRLAQQGEEWLIPIQGYDPRDLLRGHYVQYRYDWPVDTARPDQASATIDPSYAARLCIEGVAPIIDRVRALPASSGLRDPQESKGCAIIVRATAGTRREVRGLESGIFFASQGSAIELSRRLADPKLQGMVRVRIRPDGVMRPVGLEFRPRASEVPTPRRSTR